MQNLYILLFALSSTCHPSYVPTLKILPREQRMMTDSYRGVRRALQTVTCAISPHSGKKDVFDCAEIENAAHRIGMELSLTTLGPFYRSVVRLRNSSNEKGKILGYTSGSILPPLLRQDAMKIFAVNTGNQLSRNTTIKQTRGWSSPSMFGLSVLLGAYGMRYAYEKGCTKAELLAINDNEKQHEILVRHYKRLGLRPVKEVTEDISCIPGPF
jgi:hypothetical protein